MTNRLSRWLSPAEEEPTVGDYWVVRTYQVFAYVSPETAARVEAALERRWPPTWVVFRDLSGSRIRIRTRDVCGIFECTVAQRAADRRFQKACEREARGDDEVPPWEMQC